MKFVEICHSSEALMLIGVITFLFAFGFGWLVGNSSGKTDDDEVNTIIISNGKER